MSDTLPQFSAKSLENLAMAVANLEDSNGLLCPMRLADILQPNVVKQYPQFLGRPQMLAVGRHDA